MQNEFDDWRTEVKAMINKKYGLGIFDAPITRWRFTARTIHVESKTRSLLSFDYARDEGLAYIYGCDNSVDLADVIKRRYPNCRIEYELSFSIDSDDSRLVISGLTIPEANDFLRHVKPHENPLRDLVVIEFDERDEFAVPPKYSEEYFPIDDMWNMFIKHYTDEPLSTGIAIVKEEKDMAGYKLKDAHNNLNLYMVEDKPTYTPRGMVRGTAHRVKELPEAIRNVQFNEKKGVVTVIWIDGEVTMAKCGPNDIWDPEKGLAIAIMKRFFKSTTSMNKWIKKTFPEEEPVEPAKSDDPNESFFLSVKED